MHRRHVSDKRGGSGIMASGAARGGLLRENNGGASNGGMPSRGMRMAAAKGNKSQAANGACQHEP